MLQKEFSVLHDQELELYFLLDFNLWRNGCVCVGGGGGGGIKGCVKRKENKGEKNAKRQNCVQLSCLFGESFFLCVCV